LSHAVDLLARVASSRGAFSQCPEEKREEVGEETYTAGEGREAGDVHANDEERKDEIISCAFARRLSLPLVLSLALPRCKRLDTTIEQNSSRSHIVCAIISIKVPPSLMPLKRNCDVTGLEVRFETSTQLAGGGPPFVLVCRACSGRASSIANSAPRPHFHRRNTFIAHPPALPLPLDA
jgi:hypothetical protein